MDDSHLLVAAHYNRLPSGSRNDREQSQLLSLRRFNNWVKSVLLGTLSSDGACIADIACGKGGDLDKHRKNNAAFVLAVDIAYNSLVEAVKRYNNIPAKFGIQIVQCDVFSQYLCPVIPEWMRPSIFSCQFALHYAFQTEARARHFFRNVSEIADERGAFIIATVPDARIILQRLAAVAPRSNFGNEFYDVSFSENIVNQHKDMSVEEIISSLSRTNPFGVRYNFFLEGAVGNVDEYLVFPSVITDLALEFGFELVPSLSLSFQEFYSHFSREGKWKILMNNAFHIIDIRHDMPTSLQEATFLYRTWVFRRKRRDDHLISHPIPAQLPLRRRDITNDDIIVLK